MQVLLVDPDSALPTGVAQCLTEDGWKVTTAGDYHHATAAAQDDAVQAVIFPQPPADGPPVETRIAFGNLMRTIDLRRIAAILLADDPARVILADDTLIDVTGRRVTKEEIRGRLATMRRYQALVRGMEREVANLQRLSKRINQHFTEVDQEMRLAGRLQRDFLPKDVGRIGPAEFAVLFRPVSWVSGDIYDIFRIDEWHLGFYVADAVGHGMAASLLTMFIKHAITPKLITEEGYRVLDPADTLAHLNMALSAQRLPHCQFVTACYCVLNTRTLELRYARGGHPYPILLPRTGPMTDLKSVGGLLGVFEGECFSGGSVQLSPGDKVVLHSDGLEVAFVPRDGVPRGWEHYRGVIESLAPCPAGELVGRLDAMLNSEEGSINPQDDLTVVAVQIQDH